MNLIGEISALGAALLWSFSSIVFTTLSIRIGTLQLNIWRLIFAATFLGITFYFFSIPFDLTYNQYFYLSLSGIVGLVIGDTFLFASFKEIGPRYSMLIMSSNPAIAAIVAYFVFSETISIWGILGMLVTLSGIYLVISKKNNDKNLRFNLNTKGIVYGFIGAAGQGIGLILAKMAFLEGDLHGLAATQVRIVSSIIILSFLMAITGRFKNPIKLFGKNPQTIGLIALGSIIGPYLGITLSYLAIIYTEVGIAATLMSVVPILMLPLSVLIYKEKLTLTSVGGAVIAVAGVAILLLR